MKVRIVYWQHDGDWLGYLEDYPEYWTQGDTFDDLAMHLRDLYADLSGGRIPEVRKTTELEVG